MRKSLLVKFKWRLISLNMASLWFDNMMIMNTMLLMMIIMITVMIYMAKIDFLSQARNLLPGTRLMEKENSSFGQILVYWHIWSRQIWSSGVSLKRSCKMQFRRAGLRSIRPSSQKLWPNKFLADFPIAITM